MNAVNLYGQNYNVKELTSEQKSQVRRAIVTEYNQKQALNSDDEPKLGASYKNFMSPKNVAQGVISLTAVVTSLKTLAQTGFDIWDEFVKRFGKPESKEEEAALKAALNIEG